VLPELVDEPIQAAHLFGVERFRAGSALQNAGSIPVGDVNAAERNGIEAEGAQPCSDSQSGCAVGKAGGEVECSTNESPNLSTRVYERSIFDL
jgi:hypothetical protein